MMGSVIQEVRLIPNIESYSFHSVSAFTVYLYILETMGNSIEANDVFPKDIPSLEDCFTKEFLDSVASEYDYQKDWAERHETVTSEVVENVVKRLMASKEGDEMRKRAAEIGGKVRESMDEAGVSRMELDSFVAHITSSCSKLL
ncbi:hypothetical protein Pint_17845 [Pistacia integerrima]|uniref:Uncharacterized protein n=1 Tax=Pistacia integerrima TaxID=434235 RepID=A0ACC0YUR4_9ROSI|nr:hypothetical protein Pint_17845 [Pistacia integerrima]